MSRRKENMAGKEDTVWSERKVEISNLNFPLTVTFNAGVDLSEGSIINSNTVLTIHGKGSIEKATCYDCHNRRFSIPIECKKKLSIKVLNALRMFPTVRDVCKLRFVPQYITNGMEFEVHTVSFPKDTIFQVMLVCIGPEDDVLGLSVESLAPHPAHMLLPYDVQGNFKEYVLPYDKNRSYQIRELKTRKLPQFVEFAQSPGINLIGQFEPEGICRIEEIRKCNVVYTTADIDSVKQVLAIEYANACTVCVRQVFKVNQPSPKTTESEVEGSEVHKFEWFFNNMCSEGKPPSAPLAQIRALWDEKIKNDKHCNLYKRMTKFNIYSPSPVPNNENQRESTPGELSGRDSNKNEAMTLQETPSYLPPQKIDTKKKAPPPPPKRSSSLKPRNKQLHEGGLTLGEKDPVKDSSGTSRKRPGSLPMLPSVTVDSQIMVEHSQNSSDKSESIQGEKCMKDIDLVKNTEDYGNEEGQLNKKSGTKKQNLGSTTDTSLVVALNVSNVSAATEDNVGKKIRPVPAKRNKPNKIPISDVKRTDNFAQKVRKTPLPPPRKKAVQEAKSELKSVEGACSMEMKVEENQSIVQSQHYMGGRLKAKDIDQDFTSVKDKGADLHKIKQSSGVEEGEKSGAHDEPSESSVFHKKIDKDSLASFLSELRLEKYEKQLLNEQVDMNLLKGLFEDDLVNCIETTRFDARRMLLNAKHGWWYKADFEEGSCAFNSENWTTSEVVKKIEEDIKLRQFAEFCAANKVDGKLLVNIVDKEMIQSLRDEYKVKLSKIEEVKLRKFVLHAWRP